MVFSEGLVKDMAQERSKPLHNFVLPTGLKWGNQRFLRCMKVDSNGDIASSSLDRRSSESDSDRRDSNSLKRKKLMESSEKKMEESDDGIENLRAKLLLDLQTAAENMKISIQDETYEKADKEEDESAVGSAARPWNLRTRRAACKAPPISIGGGSAEHRERREQGQGQHQLNVPPQRSSPKSLRLKGLAEMAGANQVVEKERRKFSLSLSRDEIKEDLLMMTGSNPSRRPKKRAKIIQKQLNNLFPGFWLSEVTTDSYRVPDELVEAKKKK